MEALSLALEPRVQMQLAVFFLAFIRVSGIFLMTPFFSGPGIPVRLKIGVTFFITGCLAPLLLGQGPGALARLSGPLPAAVAVASELAVGFAIGMAGASVLAAIQTAGQLMAQDIGLTLANVIDPITNAQVSVIGQLKVAVALFIFLGLDFHHGTLRILATTFRLIPLGGLSDRLLTGPVAGKLGEVASHQGSMLFEAAVRLGLPVAVTLLLVTMAMGMLARAVPEMNVFIFGFGLRVLVGLWVLVLSMPILLRAYQLLFEAAGRESMAGVQALSGS
jgi:flagellar biosynthetic protein FliR